jgi:hypothetical protein
MKAGPSAKLRRFAPQVDGDIPDMSRKNPDKLALGLN